MRSWSRSSGIARHRVVVRNVYSLREEHPRRVRLGRARLRQRLRLRPLRRAAQPQLPRRPRPRRRLRAASARLRHPAGLRAGRTARRRRGPSTPHTRIPRRTNAAQGQDRAHHRRRLGHGPRGRRGVRRARAPTSSSSTSTRPTPRRPSPASRPPAARGRRRSSTCATSARSRRWPSKVQREHGKLHVLYNNVGIPGAAGQNLTQEEWDTGIEINARAQLLPQRLPDRGAQGRRCQRRRLGDLHAAPPRA